MKLESVLDSVQSRDHSGVLESTENVNKDSYEPEEASLLSKDPKHGKRREMDSRILFWISEGIFATVTQTVHRLYNLLRIS